jgi:hypothetical protein
LLAVSEDKKAAGLYPFNDISDNEYIKIYNYTSFFFYLIIPIVAFIIWDLLRNKK